ncbi:hypothetical protein B296_00024401 [Ensete ventricosum]|uniref:Uncharacterized protein n=1 Tax=Ensete ventricosum TaxID=4639 RepID=A0A426YUM3_ENSVE|nr:hypothetical protein B296_00024401 [Ensete ventricosum]
MLLQLGRSVDLKGSERSATIVDLLSFNSEKKLIADGVGTVPLLVGSDATVVVHKEDGLVQKNTSISGNKLQRAKFMQLIFSHDFKVRSNVIWKPMTPILQFYDRNASLAALVSYSSAEINDATSRSITVSPSLFRQFASSRNRRCRSPQPEQSSPPLHPPPLLPSSTPHRISRWLQPPSSATIFLSFSAGSIALAASPRYCHRHQPCCLPRASFLLAIKRQQIPTPLTSFLQSRSRRLTPLLQSRDLCFPTKTSCRTHRQRCSHSRIRRFGSRSTPASTSLVWQPSRSTSPAPAAAIDGVGDTISLSVACHRLIVRLLLQPFAATTRPPLLFDADPPLHLRPKPPSPLSPLLPLLRRQLSPYPCRSTSPARDKRCS